MTIDVLKAIPDTKRSLLLPNLARSRKQVRRCLFGAVDHDESMRFLQNELNSIQESQSRRWNFDFHDEKPINSSNGIYEWEPVQPTDDIPKAYALGRLSFLGANSSDVKESDSSVDACHGGCEQSPEVSTRLQATESAPKMVTTKGSVQRSMKDYLTSKKRSVSEPPSTKTVETPLPDSTTDLTTEKSNDSSYLSNHSAKRIRRC